MGPFDHAELGGSDVKLGTGKLVGSVAELWRYPVRGLLCRRRSADERGPKPSHRH